LPLVDLLQACKEYRIAPMISFSITSLGGTAYEPGVMKASDLLDRIEDLIGQGLINPQTTTIRIDPIVPGVTQESDVEAIIKRC
jgi:DNA repair photolyase